ncbi:MAG: DNA repair protein RecO [Gammaproteobacteria bacterium]
MSRARRAAAAPLAAYVLHRWDWSESSLIVDLFTRELGRVVVVAKGAKRPTSQLRPVLLPFQRLAVTLGRGAADDQAVAEVHPLRAAEWAGGAPLAGGAALLSGFYLNELLMKLLARHDAHATLFDAYADTLAAIGADETATQAALRAFELVLLREIGLLPNLSMATSTQQALQPRAAYVLHAETGLVEASGHGASLHGHGWVALQAALDRRGVDALRAACQAHGAPLRTMLRAVLHYHLGTPSLRTRDLVRELQRLAAPRRP